MVKRTTVTVKRAVEPSANKSARTANTDYTSTKTLPKGAPGGIAKLAPRTGTTRAPGQGPGPDLVGQDNEVGSAVPSRMLTTHVVRRASHGNATLKPGRLVDYGRSLGK